MSNEKKKVCYKLGYIRGIYSLGNLRFDLARVEAKARQYRNPRSTSIPKMMASFREILAELSGGASTWTKEKLLEVVR